MSSEGRLNIHDSAIVGEQVELGVGVEIGPFAVIEGDVEIGDETTIGPRATIVGNTTIGSNCRIFPSAVIGTEPQDLKYDGEPTRLEIGNGVQVREFATIHRGTEQGGGVTSIGDECLLMATAHVAHDCTLGSHVIMANGAALGGHVSIDSHAIVGGLVGIHQYVRIGCYAFLGGCSAVAQDVPPYVCVAGNRASPHGLNVLGLRRHGFSRERIQVLKRAYELLYRSELNTSQALEEMESLKDTEDLRTLRRFVEESERGICK